MKTNDGIKTKISYNDFTMDICAITIIEHAVMQRGLGNIPNLILEELVESVAKELYDDVLKKTVAQLDYKVISEKIADKMVEVAVQRMIKGGGENN